VDARSRNSSSKNWAQTQENVPARQPPVRPVLQQLFCHLARKLRQRRAAFAIYLAEQGDVRTDKPENVIKITHSLENRQNHTFTRASGCVILTIFDKSSKLEARLKKRKAYEVTPRDRLESAIA
jgi:hypothetical protein